MVATQVKTTQAPSNEAASRHLRVRKHAAGIDTRLVSRAKPGFPDVTGAGRQRAKATHRIRQPFVFGGLCNVNITLLF
jgi:hypothetical protein